MKIRSMFIVVLIIVLTILYIYNDVTSLYNKKYIFENTKYLMVNYKNQSFSISSSVVKNILFNKENTWVLSIVSYAHVDEMYISSNDNFYMDTHGNRIIINYKTTKYGWIQVISKNEFPKFKKDVLSVQKRQKRQKRGLTPNRE